MWVSRKEWDDITQRLRTLEDAAKYDVSKEFTIYEPRQFRAAISMGMSTYGSMIERQKIPVKDVVQRILTHLGLELKYVKGEPARIDMTSSPSAAHGEDK